MFLIPVVYHMKENPMTYSESIKALEKRVLQDCLISLPGLACFGHFMEQGLKTRAVLAGLLQTPPRSPSSTD